MAELCVPDALPVAQPNSIYESTDKTGIYPATAVFKGFRSSTSDGLLTCCEPEKQVGEMRAENNEVKFS